MVSVKIIINKRNLYKMNRLVFIEGYKVAIVAQDAQMGNAKNFTISRQDKETLNQIGAHGNIYTENIVANTMPTPNSIFNRKKIFTIIDKSSGEYLGDIRLIKWSEVDYEIGIVIIQNKRNKGYGTDAIKSICNYVFNIFNAKKNFLRVYQNNPRAKKLYQKLGFVYERSENNNYVIDGINYLQDYMSIIK